MCGQGVSLLMKVQVALVPWTLPTHIEWPNITKL
jgi:hypothetical protein